MARLRSEHGMTLIELLIAMLVMTIGIFAIVAGLASGILTIERGAKSTYAGAIADKQLEAERQAGYASLTVGPQTSSTTVASDGGTDWIGTTISWTCPTGSLSPNTPTTPSPVPTCTSGTPASRPVKLVEIEVRNTTSAGKLLFNESSTFDQSMG